MKPTFQTLFLTAVVGLSFAQAQAADPAVKAAPPAAVAAPASTPANASTGAPGNATKIAPATPTKTKASDKPAVAEPNIKKSGAGICHDKSSLGYARAKKFDAFNSLDECIKSGGRAPKSK